jgi:hypothetical protein
LAGVSLKLVSRGVQKEIFSLAGSMEPITSFMTPFLWFWVYLLCFWPVGLWAVEIVTKPKPISSPVVVGILTDSQAVWCGLNPTQSPPRR